MNGRVRASMAAASGILALLAAGVAPAAARDVVVTSADGTPIVTTFLPAEGLAPGGRAPTVLQTHGWGGNRTTDPEAESSEITGNVGVGALRRAGFNVLTWDSRGFGQSGGTVTVDFQGNEGRDVQALVDWLAGQPEARLDGPGDPRVGMHGASYGGGIGLVAAGIEPRIDAIAPDIAWHSLLTSLYKEETVKGGWAAALYGAGVPTSGLEGIVSPAGIQTGNLDPHITSAFTTGASSGKLSPEDRDWFESRGPDELVENIRIPTLLVQGTADTLFTLPEAIRNYEILRRHGVPVKMMWFCGGHGACLTGGGEAGRVERAVVAWFRRHLAGERAVRTGPGFEWLADDARWRAASAYPPAAGPAIAAQGSGRLVLTPADAASGNPIAAGPAANAVNVAIPSPPGEAQVVGEPRLELTYSGTGSAAQGHVFAQIVDDRRGIVIGNQVTPIPITLDGAPHTITRTLEGVAASTGPASRYRLQIVGGSQVYGPVRITADIDVPRARVSLPTAVGFTARGGGVLPGARTCLSRRRFEIRLHERRRDPLRSARVRVAGRLVPTRRRAGRVRAIVDLRGRRKQRVTVTVRARTRSGRILHDRRRYHTCAGVTNPERF